MPTSPWVSGTNSMDLDLHIIASNQALLHPLSTALLDSSIHGTEHSQSLSQKPKSHLYSKELSLVSPSSSSVFESQELHHVPSSKFNSSIDSRQLSPLLYPNETVKSPGFQRVYDLGRGERQGLVQNVNRIS